MLLARLWNIICNKFGGAMHRAILVMVLAAMSSSAMAEWTRVGEHVVERGLSGEQTTVTAYVDIATIRRTSNIVEMRNLFDYKTVRSLAFGDKYLSRIEPAEYDCKKGGVRTLSYSFFSGNMGDGLAVFSNNDPLLKWERIKPNSIEEILWRIVCGN